MGVGAPYAPFTEARTARPPGLSPLSPKRWLTADPDYAEQMAERARLIAAAPDIVLAALPEAAEALQELRGAVLDHCAARPEWDVGAGGVTRPDGVRVAPDPDPLRLIGAVIQEDMLLMAPGAPEYRLVAGVLCFPSRWSLAEKLGRPMTPIHRMVPGFAGDLAARVNRVFAAIRPERPMIRVNWLVHPTDMLHLPQREDEKGAPPPECDRWFLRTERQTLLRLPVSKHVAFGVKTTVTPVAALTRAQNDALAHHLAQFSAEEVDYRGGDAIWHGALEALRAARDA